MDSLRQFRDRFNIPLNDDELENYPFYRPKEDSEEIQYIKKTKRIFRWFCSSKKRKFFKSFKNTKIRSF